MIASSINRTFQAALHLGFLKICTQHSCRYQQTNTTLMFSDFKLLWISHLFDQDPSATESLAHDLL